MIAYVAVGLALGVALGFFGGGGGILAVPLLVAVGIPADEAGTTSLVVVGVAAVGGVVAGARTHRVRWREGALFGALGVVAAMAGSWLALAARDDLQLWGLTLLLLVAGTAMIRKALRPATDEQARERRGWATIVAAALGVGLVTGFFGVGGGFLVVPALVLVLGVPMHQATSTALLVIAINSSAALIPRSASAIDVPATLMVTAAAVVASVAAATVSNRVGGKALGIGFGILVLAVAPIVALQALGWRG